MPLHLKCQSCERVLVLEDAFAGAHCRCQYCRTLLSVPAESPSSSGIRPSARPARPALKSEIGARIKPIAPVVEASRTASRSHTNRNWHKILTPARISGTLAALAIAVVLPAWYLSAEGNRAGTFGDDLASSVVSRVPPGASDSTIAMLTADPMSHYFGRPLTGSTIGYVVDGDSSMAPYIDKVAYLTNSVNGAIALGAKRYGIAQAIGEEGQGLVEVAEPAGDLAGARNILTARLASGRTNLARALSVTSSWYADELFLVLAKPIDDDELSVLRQTAEQTGAVVNVIALGDAAKQSNLTEISDATRGKFIKVSDSSLDELVERQRKAELAAGEKIVTASR